MHVIHSLCPVLVPTTSADLSSNQTILAQRYNVRLCCCNICICLCTRHTSTCVHGGPCTLHPLLVTHVGYVRCHRVCLHIYRVNCAVGITFYYVTVAMHVISRDVRVIKMLIATIMQHSTYKSTPITKKTVLLSCKDISVQLEGSYVAIFQASCLRIMRFQQEVTWASGDSSCWRRQKWVLSVNRRLGPQNSWMFHIESRYGKPRMFSNFTMFPLLIRVSYHEQYSAKASATNKDISFCNITLQWRGLSIVDTCTSLILRLCIVLCCLICSQAHHPPHGDFVCF